MTTGGLKLLLVGCGRMGSAMLDGWLRSGQVAAVAVVEPSACDDDACDPRIARCADPDRLPADFLPDVIVLAVKPQMLAAVLPAYRRFARPETAFLSVAAGWTLAAFARALGDDARVIRAMPNTPAAIGRGMTVAVAGPGVSDAQRAAGDSLLAAVGEVAWVDDEAQMDAVTAVSGSGPAYVFLLAEALAAAGAAAGLPPALADRLARATVSGAGELLRRSPETPSATLRENVTSPGGTTAAALAVLMNADDGLPPLLTRAVAAATARSRELAG
jgi:pyrroline-5-carboxylate reductase